MTADQVVRALETDFGVGLDGAEAARRLARHGRNELAQAPPEPWWRRFARQFSDLLIGILIAAAVISGLLGEWVDTLAILAIVLLNGVLGFLQEERAEQALAALQRALGPAGQGRPRRAARRTVPAARPRARRPDRRSRPATASRPTSGSSAPPASASRRPRSPANRSPSDKDHREVLDAAAPLGDRANMVYMGTTVAAGKADAVVVATGMDTELGRIAGMLQRHRARADAAAAAARRAGQGPASCVVLGIVAVIFLLQVAPRRGAARGVPAVGEPRGGRGARGPAGRRDPGPGPRACSAWCGATP